MRPMVKRAGVFAHYVPEHQLDQPFRTDEITRCGKVVTELPPAAMLQSWRCPWQGDDTCRDCVAGLVTDEEEERVESAPPLA